MNHKTARLLSAAAALILVAVWTVPLLTRADSGDSPPAEAVNIRAFDRDADSKKSAHQVMPGDVFGIRLTPGAPFCNLSYCLPTWNTTDSSCTLALYRWDTDFETTVSSDALASVRIENVGDCHYYYLEFDEMPAGDYLFVIRDTVGKVGTWQYPPSVSKGVIYDSADGTEVRGDLEVTVTFTQTPKEPFMETSIGPVIDGEHTAPDAYVIPDDSLLYTHEVMPDTWVFTDGLGRTSLTNADVGDPRDNRTLALFFWDWHLDPYNAEPLNVENFIKQYPEAKNDYDHPAWPDYGCVCFWDEPVYGYYKSVDTWVIRRQGELLANAGVDVIFTDNTNGDMTWREAYRKIYETWDRAQKDGVNVPKVSCLLPFNASDDSLAQLENIYLDVYRPGKYQNLWFWFDGKPMMMAPTSNIDVNTPLGRELMNFFTFRQGQPTYKVRRTSAGSWGWLSVYPQALYYANREDMAKGYPVEQTTVGVAVNYSLTDHRHEWTAMNGIDITGRSYTTSGYHTEEDATLWGYHFSEQFDYALEKDPRVIFVTGWNEWQAGRQKSCQNIENALVDEFNDEYSRDIEPSRGALRDNYYYLFVNYVRRYKGVRPIPKPSAEQTVDIKGNVSQWQTVEPYYASYIGMPGDRDEKGYGSTHYTDYSCRNDIVGAQVSRDGDNLYFLCECARDITPYTDPLWMTLYIDCLTDVSGWESFDFVINKSAPAADTAFLERFTGNGYATEPVAEVAYTVNGRYLQIAVPKAALGLTGESFTVNFAWTDNVHDISDVGTPTDDGRAVYSRFSGDILDFYTSGDVAPGGRFKFCYSVQSNPGTAADTESDTGAETASRDCSEPTEPVACTLQPGDPVPTEPGPEAGTDTRSDPTRETVADSDGCRSSAPVCVTAGCLTATPLALKKRKAGRAGKAGNGR